MQTLLFYFDEVVHWPAFQFLSCSMMAVYNSVAFLICCPMRLEDWKYCCTEK
jgi:hypothetical protein